MELENSVPKKIIKWRMLAMGKKEVKEKNFTWTLDATKRFQSYVNTYTMLIFNPLWCGKEKNLKKLRVHYYPLLWCMQCKIVTLNVQTMVKPYCVHAK